MFRRMTKFICAIKLSSSPLNIALRSTCQAAEWSKVLERLSVTRPRGPPRKKSRTLSAEIQSEIQKSNLKSRNPL